ncbi:hypothetical protein ACI8AC_19530 [Geodermatophilus sp. SYSU D00758]
MRIRTVAVIGTAAVLLTGCGGAREVAGTPAPAPAPSTASETAGPLAGLSGPEVAAAAAAALEEAGAATVRGTVSTGAEQVTVDMHLQGADAVGALGIDGRTVQFRRLAGTVYLQGSADFWTAVGVPAGTAAVVDGVWVFVPAGTGLGLDELSIAALAAEFADAATSRIEDAVRSVEVAGEPAVVVRQPDGSTLTVAAEGPSYPLEATSSGTTAGTMTFSRFGEQVPITAPADALDLGRFGA